MTLLDADWYIEGLLNLEKAYNYHDFINQQFSRDSITLVISNDSISGDQIELVYEYFLNILDMIEANQGNPNFGFDIIDIYSVETGLKDGSLMMYMESAYGDGWACNYVPFNENDYWYWGWNMGKCNGYQGSGDAADKLEYKFNHPIILGQAGFYTSNVTLTAFPWEYDDFSNSTPWGDFMMFCYDLATPPIEEPCLSPSDLNFYLSKFDYIKEDKKPADKTFKVVDVGEDIVLGTEIRLHYYDLTYGIFTLEPPEE